MIIDAHQHFWSYDPNRQPWIDESMSSIRRDFGPKDYSRAAVDAGVFGTVAVQAEQVEFETQYLVCLAERHSFIRGVVGWIDLRSRDINERLYDCAHTGIVKGFRHVVQDEPDPDFLDDPKFRRGIAALDAFGFSYDLLILPHHLKSAKRLVEAFPNVRFVLDHLAKPDIANGSTTEWKTDFSSLAKSPNVTCKLSGLTTQADRQNWTLEDLRVYLDHAFESFGPSRLMFGSDWPVCLVAGDLKGVVEMMKMYLSEASREEQSAILWETAFEVYRLGEFAS